MSNVAQQDLQLTNRPLFGGALSISLPSSFRDVSLVRQVPDFQEVFQCVDSVESLYTDAVLVIEILERQDQVTNQEAASYFLHDLIESEDRTRDRGAGGTETLTTTILYNKCWDVGQDPHRSISNTYSDEEENLIPNLSTRVTACSCIGIHRDRNQGNRTHINPHEHPGNTSSSDGGGITVIELCTLRLEFVQTDLLITLTCTHWSEEVITSYREGHSTLFRGILKSFSIKDYSLFGC